jgi:hypothetical protein
MKHKKETKDRPDGQGSNGMMGDINGSMNAAASIANQQMMAAAMQFPAMHHLAAGFTSNYLLAHNYPS